MLLKHSKWQVRRVYLISIKESEHVIIGDVLLRVVWVNHLCERKVHVAALAIAVGPLWSSRGIAHMAAR
jgi:hypothetical protein